MSTKHDFTEHAADEDNGQYMHTCRECGAVFTAHKHWPGPCKVCYTTPTKHHTMDGVVIPPKVLEAAEFLADWFIQHGFDKWELAGVCSRNHAVDKKELVAALEETQRLTEEWMVIPPLVKALAKYKEKP